jgi:penicillin-binding protein 1A
MTKNGRRPPLVAERRARARVGDHARRDGEVFAWRGESFGGAITADTVSPHLRNAIIATEDRRFYQHFGVSAARASRGDAHQHGAGRGPFEGHGGSTITQQVAKLLCLGVPYDPAEMGKRGRLRGRLPPHDHLAQAEGTALRLCAGAALQQGRDPDDLHEPRLLGAGARGFEAAAQRYFGRRRRRSIRPQAAMLAGLLVAPSLTRRPATWPRAGARQRDPRPDGEQGY